MKAAGSLATALLVMAVGAGCGGSMEPATPDAGGDLPPAEPTGALSACVEIGTNPGKTCDDVCGSNGKSCLAACHPQGSLRHESTYYTDATKCETDKPFLNGLNGCNEDWSTPARVFGATHVRCCCGS
jgi:hypothetical protein